MIRRRSVGGWLVVPMLAAAALALGVGGARAARADTGPTRYASPTGVASATCLVTAPCDISTAINMAPEFSHVVIEPGTYDQAAPLATSLDDVLYGHLTISGEVGKPLPVIYSSASEGFDLATSSLSHVEIISSGSELAVFADGAVDHVIAITSGTNATACATYSQLTDSLCVASGAGGSAILLNDSGNSPTNTVDVTISGVTAEALGSSGFGLLAEAGTFVDLNTTVTNSILHGATMDAEAKTDAVSATSSLTVAHSDVVTAGTKGTHGLPSLSFSANTQIPPSFADPAANDFRELAGSPTINAGVPDPAGATDVLGDPRTAGGAPDMGAYEVLPKPTARALTVSKRKAHEAHLSVEVDPGGLPTTVTLVARNGKHHKSVRVSAGSGNTTRTIHLTLHGLKPHKKYRATATVTSVGGHATTSTRHFKTR